MLCNHCFAFIFSLFLLQRTSQIELEALTEQFQPESFLMVALIHVAVWGLLTTSVESATTLIGDTHSVATNADTAGMNEIEETQHATLDKNFDATPLYMSRKVREMFDSTSKQQRDHGHLFMTLKHKVAAISVRPQVEMDRYRIQHDCSP